RLYSALEFGIGVLSALATLALEHAAPVFASAETRLGPLAWALPFVLVGAPAVLMGGTLPVLVRARAPGPGGIGRAGGGLYAATPAGAILGAPLPPFTLLPALGVRGTAFTAAAVNVTLAIVTLALDRRGLPAASPGPPAPRRSTIPSRALVALGLY